VNKSEPGRDASPRRPSVERPVRCTLPHAVPPWAPDDAVFFITVNCQLRGQNQLCHAETAALLWAAVCEKTSLGQWWPHLFLVMPDHVHGLFSFPEKDGLRLTVSTWKRFTATELGTVWQRDYFDHRLRAEESFSEKAHYIRQNPVRKGLVTSAEDWPHVWSMVRGNDLGDEASDGRLGEPSLPRNGCQRPQVGTPPRNAGQAPSSPRSARGRPAMITRGTI
jgi:REP element-mobilizing transposase RayT